MTVDTQPVALIGGPGMGPGSFVALSELSVPEGGRPEVDAAFQDRLHAVDAWPGFRGLQVWADLADSTRLIMISWWDSHECFAAYMHSDDHRRSHERVPTGDLRPRPVRFRRLEVIAS